MITAYIKSGKNFLQNVYPYFKYELFSRTPWLTQQN